MKLRLTAGPLADALSFVACALPDRAVVPVLAGVKLRTTDAGLRLSAFDYDTSAATRVAAMVADQGAALVPGRLLSDIARNLPKNGAVELELDGPRLRLRCGASCFALPTLPLDDYPALPVVPDAVATLDADALADAVAQVAPAAARDQTLPVLTGIQLSLAGDLLRLTATDRYRIAEHTLTVTPTGSLPARTESTRTGKQSDKKPPKAVSPVVDAVLMPAAVFTTAAKSLTGAGQGTASLHWNEHLAALRVGDRTLTTRLLDENFPNMTKMLDLDDKVTCVTSTSEALAALGRVALVASSSPVRLKLHEDHIEMDAGVGDDAQAVDRIPACISGLESGGPYTIAFNPGYLADALRALQSPEVQIAFVEPNKPALFTGVPDGMAGCDYRHLLMPVRVHS